MEALGFADTSYKENQSGWETAPTAWGAIRRSTYSGGNLATISTVFKLT